MTYTQNLLQRPCGSCSHSKSDPRIIMCDSTGERFYLASSVLDNTLWRGVYKTKQYGLTGLHEQCFVLLSAGSQGDISEWVWTLLGEWYLIGYLFKNSTPLPHLTVKALVSRAPGMEKSHSIVLRHSKVSFHTIPSITVHGMLKAMLYQ